ncbi:MAG: hypothetical protein ABN478_09510 [Mixta sp.]
MDIIGNMEIKGKNILLLGTCEYEMLGLTHILTELGCCVLRNSEVSSRYKPYLTVVALSAEPLLGWGKHISFINEIFSKSNNRVLIVAPKRYSNLTLLKRCCFLLDGQLGLEKLRESLSEVLEEKRGTIKDYYNFTSFYSGIIQAISMTDDEKRALPSSTCHYRKKRIFNLLGLKNNHEYNLLSVCDMQKLFKPFTDKLQSL